MKIFFYFYYILSKLLFILLYSFIPKRGGLCKKLRLKIENRIFFSPRIKKIYPIIPELKGKIEPLNLMTKDCVRIFAWHINPHIKDNVVVFCHGQSENISKWQDTALFLQQNNIGALFLSYRGHYRSAGLPSEQGVYIDAETAVEYLNRKGISHNNIIFWGRSLGSSVACEAALRYDLKGVILESAIFDIKTAAVTISDLYLKMIKIKNAKPHLEKLFEKTKFIQNFENNKKLPDIKCPILILHGKNDVKIPYEKAQELHSLNKNAKLHLSEEGTHNTNEWCYDRVKTFIEEVSYVKS